MTYSDRTLQREALTAAAFLCRARHGRKSQEPTCASCLAAITRDVEGLIPNALYASPAVDASPSETTGGEVVAWPKVAVVRRRSASPDSDIECVEIGDVPQDDHEWPPASRKTVPVIYGEPLRSLRLAAPPAGDGVPRVGESCLMPLARLGAWVLAEMRENASDIDGGDVQDKAEECGVVAPEPAQKPCCENCACAEFGADICYRNTQATNDALAALSYCAKRQGGK